MLEHVLRLWPAVPDAAGRIGADRVRVLEWAVEAAHSAGDHARGTELATEALALVDRESEPVRAALLLVRRQSLKAAEPFLSVPTKRVLHALLPAFLVGYAAGVFNVLNEHLWRAGLLAMFWVIVYGCAIHAAGFFMPRGMKLFGWLFVIGGCAIVFASQSWPELRAAEAGHYIMGGFFGLAHLAYGVYLYFTEKRSASA